MRGRFDKFVQDENIKYFKTQIIIETEPVRLVLLKKLLEEEEAKSRIRLSVTD